MGSVAGTGGVAVGCAAGHRRGVCILALPLTVRNQELSGGFMDLIKRAIKDMAHSVDGGYASVAAALGLSSRTALENRLYQVKGQRVSIEEALAIQRISGRNDFAEAVAAESGGVFVRLPDDVCCAALAEEEISAHFLSVIAHVGEMVEKWRESTADGEVSERELADLLDVFRRGVAEQAAVIELTKRYFVRDDS